MSARGGLSGKPQSTRQNVRVVCRVRPTNQKEASHGGVNCVKATNSTIEVACDGNQNSFSFDRVYGPDSSQMEVFQDTAFPLIGDVLSGYNATVFAYGQTGTGKVRNVYFIFPFSTHCIYRLTPWKVILQVMTTKVSFPER